jgi:VIT1/CCC1 family predicted Fe2+/Mn2+ transporter
MAGQDPSSGVPTIVIVILVLAALEAIGAVLSKLRFKKAIAYVHVDDWARRHGL